MKTINLAVVTPTLNEEHYVGKLLDSLVKQTVTPQEIIIVDAYSQDKTIAEIKKRQKELPQLSFYQIPKSTISKQRNYGVFKATQPHILFLDADAFLKDHNALECYYQQILNDPVDIAAAFNQPDSRYWKDQVYFWLMNTLFKAIKPVWPIALGINLYVRRDVFQKIGGFDERIKVGEDVELVQRFVKKGQKFKLLKEPSVHTSVRRFEKEGRRRYTFKTARNLIVTTFRGYEHVPDDYQFGEFSPPKPQAK